MFLKKLTGKPLIIDLRDPTIALPFYKNRKSFSLRWNFRFVRRIEKHILGMADRVIFTTRKTEESYSMRYPFLKGKTSHIYNGFYSIDFNANEIKPFDKFTITYIGNYYLEYSCESENIFKALRQLLDKNLVPRNNISFIYMGDNYEWFKGKSMEYRLEDIIQCHERVSRTQSIKTLFQSSVVFLRIVEDMISTKLYEGLMTGNPILAPISNEEVIGIIKQYSPQSINVNPHDSDALAEAIENLYNSWKHGRLCRKVNEKYLSLFNKKSLTKEFAKELNTLVHLSSINICSTRI
jgi:glycosyltransferase involved in cell wall biosynthesis